MKLSVVHHRKVYRPQHSLKLDVTVSATQLQ